MSTDLTALLSRWPECRRVVSVRRVNDSGYSRADVFRVRTDAAEFALRRWPEGSLPTPRIYELHRFLRFLEQSGIEVVSVPRPDDTGATVVSFLGSHWQLEPWMKGTAISRQPSPKQLTNAMRALAKLHLAAARYEPTETGREWFYRDPAREAPAVIERLKLIRNWDEDRLRVIGAGGANQQFMAGELLRLYARVAPTIAHELESCKSHRVHIHPCLRDVHREHVLISGDEVTGIIDPSAARSENVASDLSRLLGSILGDHGWKRPLESYSEVRPLSEEEWRLSHVLGRSGVALSALTWIRNAASGAVFSPRIQMRVVEIQQRLRSLADGIDGL